MRKFPGAILFAFLLFVMPFTGASAESLESVEAAGKYRLHYSVFNSMMLTPAIAGIHHLVRKEDVVYINIALTGIDDEGNESLGREAEISGRAKNLIGQIRELPFKTIREGDVVYYLAPLQHTNEEIFHFDVQAAPAPGETPVSVRFTRKLYKEEEAAEND